MGQEASTLHDPSVDGHYPDGNGTAPTSSHATAGSDEPNRVQAIKNMATVATGTVAGMLQGTKQQRNDDKIDGEVARAAAQGGHFDFAASQQFQYPQDFTPEQQQHVMQQQMLHSQQHQNYTQEYSPPPPPPGTTQSPPPAATVNTMYASGQASSGSSSRPGQRLIKSMRNLKIGGGVSTKGFGIGMGIGGSSLSRGVGPPTHPETHEVANLKTTGLPPLSATVNDWQRHWDDDESDEEDDGRMPLAAVDETPSMMLYPPLRPGMDQGHGMISPPLQPTVAAAEKNGAAMQQQFERQVSDGIEWDTGVVTAQKHKPNIEMFLPMLRVLGKGSFGKVVLVQKNTGDDVGTLFAMKILRKEYLKRRRQVERTQTERKVLSVVNHPFIMKMHYAFQSEDKLFFVLDYCAGGELFFHLSRFRRFPERVARFYTAELVLAIGHLHKRHIIYRDLKPENVLIDAEGHVKLGDFGLAKTGIRHPCEGAMSMCGTPEYMAPEVLLQTGHGFCVDYWGLGMLLYEMMTGLPPWYTTDRAKLFRRLKSAPLEIPSFFSESCASCVSALLERSPRRRLGYSGVKQVMEHAFFRPIHFKALYARKVEPPIRPCDGWSEAEALAAINSPGGCENAKSEALARTTANFDETFTTMPVDLDDDQDADDYDDGSYDDSNGDHYVGFTFDNELGKTENTGTPQRARTHARSYHNRQTD